MDLLPPEAVAGGHTGPEVLDNDIGPIDQPIDHGPGLGLREVAGQAELALVGVRGRQARLRRELIAEVRRQPSHRVDSGHGLGMHDRGAVVGELARDERAGGHPGEVDNLEPAKTPDRGSVRIAAGAGCTGSGTDSSNPWSAPRAGAPPCRRSVFRSAQQTGRAAEAHLRRPRSHGEQLRISKQILGIVRRRDQQFVGD